MKRFRHFTLVAAVVAVAAVATTLLASCSHGGSGSGAAYTGGGSSGGSGSPSGTGSGTTTATYVSYDQAGGYLNIDGGKYQTCILSGNSEGGTITLTDGIKDDLTGTYGVPASGSGGMALAASAVSLASSISVDIRIEGTWDVTVHASGTSSGISFTLFAAYGMITLKTTDHNGNTGKFTAGTATDIGNNPDSDGTPIIPGSAEDPFNGTDWGQRTALVGIYRFENGSVYTSIGNFYICPYLVRRTSEGYKVCFNFAETNFEGNSNGTHYRQWSFGFNTFTIASMSATESNDLEQTEFFSFSDCPTNSYNLHEFRPAGSALIRQ